MENKIRLSKETMIRLPVGSSLTLQCSTVTELDAAYQNACYVRRTCPRDDGNIYRVRRLGKSMTVVVTVEEGEKEDG